MRFQYDPNRLAGGKPKAARGAGRHVHRECHSRLDAYDDRRSPLLERSNFPFQNIASAEPLRTLVGEQDVSGANRNFDAIVWRSVTKRHLNLRCALLETYAHHAVNLAQIQHRSAKQVFKSQGLRELSVARRAENGMRIALADDTPLIEDDDPFAERFDFFAGMRHVNDGNFLLNVPGA